MEGGFSVLTLLTGKPVAHATVIISWLPDSHDLNIHLLEFPSIGPSRWATGPLRGARTS
jgi:hypothetical protein